MGKTTNTCVCTCVDKKSEVKGVKCFSQDPAAWKGRSLDPNQDGVEHRTMLPDTLVKSQKFLPKTKAQGWYFSLWKFSTS